jgi:TolB-like protein
VSNSSREDDGPSFPETAARHSAQQAETSNGSGGLPEFWARLHEHKVLQWGLAYLGAALAIAHGAELVGHAFNWSEVANRILMGVLVVGLPIALALAWYHGHRSLRNVTTGEATIIALLVAIGAGLLVALVRTPEGESREEAALRATPAHSTEATAATVPGKATAGGETALAAQGPSIAVLPFVNMTSDPEQEYFSDGLAEELLDQLAHLPNLRVIGRTSSFAFKGKNEDLRVIGATLGVNHILEGSVRKSGNRVRITAQLIDPATGSHVWSDVYDKELGNIFAVQEEIARAVAANLRVKIGNDPSSATTHNLEAYDEFLRARRVGLGPGTDFPMVIGHLERAVALDPQFVDAWTMLIQAYNGALVNIPERSAEWLPKQDRALQRALALAPQSPSVKVALAGRELAAGNLVKAEQLMAEVKDMPPGLVTDGHVGYSLFLMGVGRPKEAVDILERLRDADPLATFPSLLLQVSYEIIGDYDAAETEYQRLSRIGLDSYVLRGTALVRAMAVRNTARLRNAGANTGPPSLTLLNQAMVKSLDDPRAALTQLRRALAEVKGTPDVYQTSVIGQWAAYFGDPALSLQAVRAMPRIGAGGPGQSVLFTLWRPILKDVRRLPAFKDYVRQLGLVDYWRATGKWGDFCRPVSAADFQCL